MVHMCTFFGHYFYSTSPNSICSQKSRDAQSSGVLQIIINATNISEGDAEKTKAVLADDCKRLGDAGRKHLLAWWGTVES